VVITAGWDSARLGATHLPKKSAYAKIFYCGNHQTQSRNTAGFTPVYYFQSAQCDFDSQYQTAFA